MRALAYSDSHLQVGEIPVEATAESSASRENLGRLAAVDAGRVFATFAIVWVHNLEGMNGGEALGALCRFGTSFYIIVAALFVVRSAVKPTQRTFIDDVLSRSKRLLKPYLVWCLVYGLYYGAYAYAGGHSWESLSRWWGPVAGTAVHLWFLPFVFFWGTIAAAVVPHLLKVSRPALLLGGLATAVVLYLFCFRWLHFAVSRPWLWEYKLHRLDRWIVDVPLFVTATLVMLNFERLGRRAKSALKKASVLLALACFAGFVIVQTIYAAQVEAIKAATHTEGRFMAHLAGLLFLGGFIALNRSRFVRFLAPLGRYTYLVFLVHMLVIEVVRPPATQIYGYGTPLFTFLSSLVVFAIGLGLAWLIQNLRPLKFLRA